MFCTECGASLNIGSKSCITCGSEVEVDSVADIKEQVPVKNEITKSHVSGELSKDQKVKVIFSVVAVIVIGFVILNYINNNHQYVPITDAEMDQYAKEHPDLNSKESEFQSNNVSEHDDQNQRPFILNGDLSSIKQPATFDAYLTGGGNQEEFTLKNNWLIIKIGDSEIKEQVQRKSFPDYNCIGIHPKLLVGNDIGEYLVCQMLDSGIIQSSTWTAPNSQTTAVQMEKNEVFYISGWRKDSNPAVYKIVLRKP